MPDALSVDALCGFGAKNLIRCTEFIQQRVAWSVNGPRFIGHSTIFYTAFSSVMVRSREKCLMSERLRCDLSAKARVEVVRREAGDVRRYAAVLSLGALSFGRRR